MDSWFTTLLSFANWVISTKLGFPISFNLNFFLFVFFDLVDGVEFDGVFSSGKFFFLFFVEGFWSSSNF